MGLDFITWVSGRPAFRFWHFFAQREAGQKRNKGLKKRCRFFSTLRRDSGHSSRISLGRFQRVDLLMGDRRCPCSLHVRGQVATSAQPFGSRIRTNLAITPVRVLQNLPASLALLNDLVAGSAVERASFRSHEDALHALLDCRAFHYRYLLNKLEMILGLSLQGKPFLSMIFCSKRALPGEPHKKMSLLAHMATLFAAIIDNSCNYNNKDL